MKIPLPMPAEQLIANELNNINTSSPPPPGKNPWTKFIIVGGVLVGIIIIALSVSYTEPTNFTHKTKDDSNGNKKQKNQA